MPAQSQRQHLLKKISGRINKIAKINGSKAFRRYQAFLELQRVDIESERYVSRPKEYKKARSYSAIEDLLASLTSAFRFLFRVTRSEFHRLVRRLEGYESLARAPGPGRPPAPACHQIALYLYRQSHSHEVKAISRLFAISEGTVVKWSDNACEAIQTLWNELVNWPGARKRVKIKDNLLARYGVPDCLGFIDGIHIPLYQAPWRPDKSAGTYYTRKGRYALNVLAVVDHKKRFRLVHYGHTGATNDCTHQKDMPYQRGNGEEEGLYFDDDEHIVGDSGFTPTERLIAMCKRKGGAYHLYGLDAYLNYKLAPTRVNVEHTFGIFKARWKALTNLRLTLHEIQDERRAYGWIKCAIILHNLYVSTWQDVLSQEEVQAMVKDAQAIKGREGEGGRQGEEGLEPAYKRRRDLARKMLRLEREDERPDMDTFVL